MGVGSQIRAGAAYVEITTRDSKLVKGLASASKRLKNFGASVTSLGLKLGAGGGLLKAAFLGTAKIFADAGSELVDMSQRTGLTVEALSELGYAAEQSGSDLESLETGTKKMQKLLADAADGNKEAVDTLEDLGLSLEALGTMTPDQQLATFADALHSIGNPAQRTAQAIKVFGKAGTGLLPLFAEGSAGIDALRKQAQELGLTWDTETAQGAEAFGDQISTVWQQSKKIAAEIGGALLPDLKQLASRASEIAAKTIAWIKQNRELIALVARIAAGVALAGVALVVLGGIFTAIGTAMGAVVTIAGVVGSAIGAIGAVIGFLLSPIGLAIAAVTALAGYFLYASGAAGEAMSFVSSAIGGLVDDSTAAFGAIGQALAKGDIGLAARILWLTLKLEWQKGIAFLNTQWQAWKAFFLNVANEAVSGLAKFFTNAWAGIQVAWIETTNFLADTFSLFGAFLKKTWNNTIGFIRKAWVRLKALFGADIDVNAEVSKIDQETNAKNKETDDARDKAIVDREAKRKADEKKIETDRAAAAAILEDERKRKEQAILDAQNKATQEGVDELDAARKDWNASIAEAAQTAPGAGPAAAKPKGPEVPQLDAIIPKVDVSGTFNAAAVEGLGTESAAAETARNTRETAANTKKIAKKLPAEAQFT